MAIDAYLPELHALCEQFAGNAGGPQNFEACRRDADRPGQAGPAFPQVDNVADDAPAGQFDRRGQARRSGARDQYLHHCPPMQFPGIGREKPCGTLSEDLNPLPVRDAYMKTADLE